MTHQPPEVERLDPIRRLALRFLSALVFGAYRLVRGDRLVVGRGAVCNHRLIIRGPGRVVIGAGADLFTFGPGRRVRLMARKPDATIRIGERARLNGTELHADTSIDVGPDCILGQAFIADTDAHSMRSDRRTDPDAPVRTSAILIERNVWVARQAAILPGVTVGTGSVVAYGAIVTSDVPPNVLVAGNPARVVRSLPD
jgi:hypothetical protein